MNFRRNFLAATMIVSSMAGASFAADTASNTVGVAIQAAVADPGRPPIEVLRDAVRRPADVVAFSQIKRGNRIAEIAPGEGYYTRILSKLVGPKGHVYTIVPRPGWHPTRDTLEKQRADLKELGITGAQLENPRVFFMKALGLADVFNYGNVTALWEPLDQFGGLFAVPEQLDAVWTSDNYHDFHNRTSGPLNMVPVNKAIFAALKPGGVYLIVDHAAAKGANFSVTETLHRSEADAVKKEVLEAGFVLDGESSALANPADDRTEPVFQMHDKTDQFVLRFRKLASAPRADKRPPANAMNGYFGNTQYSSKGNLALERHVFYQADGSFIEYGPQDLGPILAGLWFWDAAGHNCMIHQYPDDWRNVTVCHDMALFKKPGDTWQIDGFEIGRPGTYSLGPGQVPLALPPHDSANK